MGYSVIYGNFVILASQFCIYLSSLLVLVKILKAPSMNKCGFRTGLTQTNRPVQLQQQARSFEILELSRGGIVLS